MNLPDLLSGVSFEEEIIVPESVKILQTVNALKEGKFSPENIIFKELSSKWADLIGNAIKGSGIINTFISKGVLTPNLDLINVYKETRSVLGAVFTKEEIEKESDILRSAKKAFDLISEGKNPQEKDRVIATKIIYGFWVKENNGSYDTYVPSSSGIGDFRDSYEI